MFLSKSALFDPHLDKMGKRVEGVSPLYISLSACLQSKISAKTFGELEIIVYFCRVIFHKT